MNSMIVLLGVYVSVSLMIAAVFLLLRDFWVRRTKRPGPDERQPLVLPTEPANGAAESPFSRLVTQTGSTLTPETAFLLAMIAGLAVGGTLFLWQDDWLAAVAGAMVGILVVVGVLFYLRSRRHLAIREQLPDVMDLMARAVRAGESLDQAIVLAGNSSFQPVSAEFRRCARQMEMGLSLDAAMRGLVRRAPLVETRVLAMTLVVQRQKGGSLPTTLERLARVFRDRLNYYRQFRASTTAGRSSAALIAIIALILDAVVLLVRPEYVQPLVNSTPGRIMLATAIVLQVIGVTWALWLFRSDD